MHPGGPQAAADQVEGVVGEGVAHVAAVIWRDPADIHPDSALARRQWNDRGGCGVEELHVDRL